MPEPMTINQTEPLALVLSCGEATGLGYSIVPGSALAVLPVVGPLIPEWSMAWIKDAARAVKDDPNCAAMCVRLECPGGYVRGMDDLLAALREVAAVKPVFAVASMAASGGYWIGTVARELAATPTSVIGSIGVMGGVFYDTSKTLEAEGVKVHVAATSTNKAIGAYGVAITPEMIAAEQKMADSMGAVFFADVARARKMTVAQVKSLNAESMTGQTAYALGLVDRVVPSCDSYIAEIAAKYPSATAVQPVTASVPVQDEDSETTPPGNVAGTTAARAAGATEMSESNTNVAPAQTTDAQGTAKSPVETPATASQLAAAIDDPAFCFKAMQAEMTLTQAMAAFIKHQAASKVEPKGAAPVTTGTRSDAPATPAVAKASDYFASVLTSGDTSDQGLIDAGRAMFSAPECAPVPGVVRPKFCVPKPL